MISYPAMRLLIALLFCSCSFAKAPSPPPKTPEAYAAEVAGKFQKSWDTMKSYQANFKQIVFSKRMGTRDETEGLLSVIKPDKLRWETKTDGSVQILNGKKMINVQENKRRKNRVVDIYSDVRKVTSSTPLNFLSGKSKFKDIYHIKLLSETPKAAELKLSPKKEGEETLIAEVDKASYFLRSLTTENAESRVRIEFSDIKTNAKLDKGLFEFKPDPKDVVHEE